MYTCVCIYIYIYIYTPLANDNGDDADDDNDDSSDDYDSSCPWSNTGFGVCDVGIAEGANGTDSQHSGETARLTLLV